MGEPAFSKKTLQGNHNMRLWHHVIELCAQGNLTYHILYLSPHCHPEEPTGHRPSSPHRHLSFIAEDVLYHDFSHFYIFLNYFLYLSFLRVWISTLEEPVSIFLTIISWVLRIRIGVKRRKYQNTGEICNNVQSF